MASSSRQAPEVDGFTPPPPPVAESNKDSQLASFWKYQREQMAKPDLDVKQHPFPLATMKKIMKADKDVKMVSADAPVLMAKACEFFVQELTMKAWSYAEKRTRRTLCKDDIVNVVNETDDYYDFLFDLRHDCPSWIKKDDHPAAMDLSSPPAASEDSFFGRMIEWPMTGDDQDQEENFEDDGVGVDWEADQENDDNVEG